VIVSVGRDWSHSHAGFVLCLPKSVPFTTMRRRAKARAGSYAANMVQRLHDSLFIWSLDLKHDYITYFAVEYDTFEQYLLGRHSFPTEAVAGISAEFGRSGVIVHASPAWSFVEDEDDTSFLQALVEPTRAK
jgi:hypothetical protein